MTENDCIGAKELCVLEQTCKNALSTICTEEVWEALCLRTWPNSKHLNVQFLSKAGGHRAWYMLRRPTGAITQPREPLPPPRRNARDIFFWVDIKAGDSPIISTLHSGERHLKLDVEGSAMNQNGRSLFRSNPNVGGAEYVLGETGEILSASSYRSEAFTVEVQMSIHEQTCHRICPVMYPDAAEFFFNKRAISKAYERGDAYVSAQINHHSWKPCMIRSSLLGSAIQQRLGNFFMGVVPVARFTEGRTKIVIDSLRYRVVVGHSTFNKERQQEKGVSILHILEELEGQIGERKNVGKGSGSIP